MGRKRERERKSMKEKRWISAKLYEGGKVKGGKKEKKEGVSEIYLTVPNLIQ